MARVVFAIQAGEAGHMNCSLALAKQLRAAGHVVEYLGLSSEGAAPAQAGFGFVSLADAFPGGAAAELDRSSPEGAPGPIAALREMAAGARRYRAMLEDLAARAHELGRHGWDLMVCDGFNWPGLFLGQRAGLKTVALSTTFPLDPELPPPSTTLVPDGTMTYRIRSAVGRRVSALPESVGEAAANVARLVMPSFDDLRKMFGVPRARLHRVRPHELNLPTLIACPRALEFEHAPSRSNDFYVDPLVDLERRHDPFDAASIGDAPLVYVAMGTQTWQIVDPVGFFRRVVRAAELCPRRRFLVSLGAHVKPADVGAAPPNVTLVDRTPQLAVLARARLMLTHAGLNTMKECILSGVPQVLLPVTRDQPTNAARAAHHGLGRIADYRRVSPSELAELVEEVDTNPSYRLATRLMRERFVAAEEARLAVGVVERVLAC